MHDTSYQQQDLAIIGYTKPINNVLKSVNMTIKANYLLFQPKGYVEHCLLLYIRLNLHPARLSWTGPIPGEMPHEAVAPYTTDMLCTAYCSADGGIQTNICIPATPLIFYAAGPCMRCDCHLYTWLQNTAKLYCAVALTCSLNDVSSSRSQ